MDINRQLIEDKIRDAQYVLVGIGEEFAVKEDGGRTKEKVLQAYKNLSGLLDDKSYFIVTLLTDDLIFGTDLKASQIVAPCGSDMSGNVVTNEHYDESCYLPQWQNYLKWLQNTLNRKLCILELGVGFQYPSVIRWPFEKTGYLNKKADFIRVHSKFPQMSEELKDKGISVGENPVDFLLENLSTGSY
ncbi:hypothetical protein [Murimonas intestini]|uniref:Uncharacterized protein n=1 Tax=Murimonas intestini TaxID=1337051 RepID=A0AB73T4M1_9FIRM|nr:hypothetical protein [Murimonas intestini]MCR1840485.1 hypothetical protein [Murimonas intestini]MCR1865461.1 hypothetical protein [Murimonas intestini]MCR1882828.1 hypothetical protein [Murimonas intestini]